MNILDEIIENKRKEVELRKELRSESVLQNSQFFERDTLSLKKFLLDKSRTGIIAEFKRRSPSKGLINSEADVVDVTSAYAKYGASGISVLTDEKFFGGSSEDLQKARVNEVPILRKDFMIDSYQVVEAKSIGADVILLIAACLTPAEVRSLASHAHSLKMEVLLEIHDESELDHITDGIELVGINNRNLKTFSVDLEQSVRLAEKLGNKIRIAESGINDIDNIRYLRRYGFNGFLIGENFMKERDPGAAFSEFAKKIN